MTEYVPATSGEDASSYVSDDLECKGWTGDYTASKLISESTDVFTGSIIGIGRGAFEGDVAYVVYKIGVKDYYKGQFSEVQTLEVPSLEDSFSPEIGVDYLFLTVRSSSDVNLLRPVVNDQYAYLSGSDEAKIIISMLEEKEQ